ncbi:MAG: flagellar filament capping protein FliD, partial [candidate division Zixibacteria bacterium]|nr:flagellar filament capping protein FliD [candidate division Zixibacteria bacterium]
MPVGSISGIASNLDTQAIVEAMLAYENNNGILIQARQQEITNKMSAWNSISAYLLSFKAKASILSRESAWHSKSLSNSDDSIFTATANTNATPGVYNISVNSLAAQQQLASQGFSSSTAAIGTGTIVIQVGENAAETITIDSTNNTLEGLRDAINDADAGVSASIINDGSSNNAYRLILTSEGTGLENSIDLTIDLADGTAPDFTNTSFDTPETLSWDTNATAEPSLGDTASYTGTQNKIYTFTLQGSGEMTVGSGDIYIDWSDGTNSGTITVSSADTEVALSGDGSDGLKLKFSAGELYGGDTFQVQSFSPVLQEAGDAQIEVGNSSGGGSPILITSSSNTITNVIEGVTLNLLQVSDSGPNTLTVELDKNGIANTVQGLVQEYNTMVDYLGEMMDYNPDTETAGILIGDIGLMSLQNRVHRLMANPVAGLDSDLSRLLNIGVTTGVDGQLKFDRNVLFEKLDEDLEGVI